MADPTNPADISSVVSTYLDEKTGGVAQEARYTMTSAVAANPDYEAELRKVARTTGVPVDTVRAFPEELKQQATLAQFDFDGMAAEFPRTAAFLSGQENAAVAHDDTGNMTAVEKTLGVLGRGGRAMLSAAPSFAGGVYGLGQGILETAAPLLDPLAGTLLPGNPLRGVAAELAERRKQQDALAKQLLPKGEGNIESGVYSGLQSIAQNIPALALGVATGNPALALGMMTAPVGGSAYGEARDKGVSPTGAAIFGASQAAIEFATERIPMGRLLGDLKVGTPFYKMLARNIAAEVPGEQVATVLQDLNEWAILNPEKPFSAYVAERPGAATQTLVATIVGAGGTVSVVRGVDAVMNRDRTKQEQAGRAETVAAAVTELNTLAAASKVRARDSQTFDQFVAAAAADGDVQDLFISAQTLAQSGLAEQVAAASPAVREQYATALETGTDIRIPLAEYAANIAPEGFAQGLVEHLKADPQGFSQAEAATYMETRGEQLQQEVQAAMTQMDGDQTMTASREAVQTQLLDQLNSARRFTTDVNQQYATLASSFYAVQAARLGITPEEMYARYPLRIVAQQPLQGAAFNQDAPTLAAVKSQWEAAGINGAVSENGDMIRLSKIVVPAEGREAGAGTAAMQQLIDYADATGKAVALTPSADFGGSKARLVKFYKRFGFVENKGRNKDFSTQESMIRPARAAPAALNQGEGQRGSFDPKSMTVSLLKGADLSTFLHEMGHFQLEVLTDIASRPDAPAEVIADVDTLLKWFGVESTPEVSALQNWKLMSLDEQRESHEKFARGFEAYLFEGKAPNAELRPIFQRFRAWLVSIYRQLKALDVKLTDDVRSVMDRMLATADQIQETEAVNSMGLLFETPEQAAEFGVEWKAYHDQGLQATQDAVTELEARSLRDMKWLTNAKARELRKLQRQAKNARREVETEVRREVMSQPVYRAWQFLTGRDSGAAPIEDAPAQSAYKADLADWNTERSEVYDAALAKIKAAAWEAAPESKAEYPDARAKGMAKGQFMNRNGKVHRANAEVQALEWEGTHPKPAKPTAAMPDFQTAPELSAGKLKTSALRETYGAGKDAPWRKLSANGMTSDTRGLAPEYVAETFGFGSADEMVRRLAEAPPPDDIVRDMADQRMLERYGELSTPEALEAAANEAVHNEARARAVATEQKALNDALNARQDAGTDRNGRARSIAVLPAAARQFAADTIARLKVRDVKPAQYRAAEGRAGRDAQAAMRKSDLPAAAIAKRNQLINFYAARAAQDALTEVDKAVAYFRRVEGSDTIDADYRDQIQALLDRYELRSLSLREIDKRKSLAEWVAQQQEIGLEPDIPPEFMREASRQSYRDMTVEELRGLRDTVRQIEKLGRLKHQLLTARDQRTFEEVRDRMAASIDEFSQGRKVDPRTPTTNLGRWFQSIKNFGAAHIKAATWVRVMDGGKAGVMWDYIVRPANERGDKETTMRAEATAKLTEIMAPVLKQGKLGGKGTFFPSINRSLNKESVLAIALNTGNQSNLQRLLGGENWSMQQITPVLDTLTAQDWQAVQAIWDFFESYRPQIGAKQRRVYGTEPNWIDPTPVVTKHGTFRGGYYPVKYDPAASVRAEEHADAEGAAAALKGAYSAATTRRSFTKARAEEVTGRPLLYTMQGMYSGVNEVIHDLAWHEWLIDVNRLLKSEKVDSAIRTTYGPEAIRQLKTWRDAIAAGDVGSQEAIDSALSAIRQNVSAAGLGYNVMSAATQFLGAPQSMARVGAGWFGKGMQQYISNPIKRTREVNAKSQFMTNRARTRYRELNELRNRVQGQRGVRQAVLESAYVMMMRMQQMIDVPTWLGGYERAIAEGSDEARAIALADQGVIDSQGGGQTKDLSAIERGGPAQKIYTSFYSFMNTTLNVLVARGMTHRSAAKTAADILLISIAPSMLMEIMKDLLTPGGGEDDDYELWKKLASAGLDAIFGLVVLGREFSEAAAMGLGISEFPRGYSGPSGLRLIGDTYKLGQQVGQGEFDDSFRKASINLTGSLFGLPAAQINRTITGAQALAEGETENPAALVFGFKQ